MMQLLLLHWCLLLLALLFILDFADGVLAVGCRFDDGSGTHFIGVKKS